MTGSYDLFPKATFPNSALHSNVQHFAGMAFTILDSLQMSSGGICHQVTDLESAGLAEPSVLPSLPISKGHLNNTPVTVLRDTGCSTIGVRRSLVSKSDILHNRTTTCVTFNGDLVIHEMAEVHITSPYFSGNALVCLCDNRVADVIIGNVKGALLTHNTDFVGFDLGESSDFAHPTMQVVTRAQSSKTQTLQPLAINNLIAPLEVLSSDFGQLQSSDVSLSPCFRKANKKKNGSAWFYVENGLLFRKFTTFDKKQFIQLVVPTLLRQNNLSLAHETLMVGHMGFAKTLNRILNYFYWPGVAEDTKRFCTSCDICQKGKLYLVVNRLRLHCILYQLLRNHSCGWL